jgi:hypothetical protein
LTASSPEGRRNRRWIPRPLQLGAIHYPPLANTTSEEDDSRVNRFVESVFTAPIERRDWLASKILVIFNGVGEHPS